MKNHIPLSINMQIWRVARVIGLVTLLFTFLWGSSINMPATTLAYQREPATDKMYLSPTNEITIGVGAAISVIPDLAWRQVNAVHLAIDQVNARGGINLGGINYSLTVVEADDGCNAAGGAAAANTLIDAGAVAVVGYTCSSASGGAQPIHADKDVPMISPSSTRNDLTEQGYLTTFRTISRDDSSPILLATYLRQWLNRDRAAIVELDGFGENWANDTISTTFTSLGGTITSRHSVPSIDDFPSTLTTIQSENPQVIFYSDSDAKNAAILSKTAHNLGMSDVIMAWITFSNDEPVLEDYADEAGGAAEGDHAAMFYRRIQDMPGYLAFNEAYRVAGFPNHGDDAGAFGAFAYDAANIIIDSILRAQSTNPTDIRNAIAATKNFKGVVGVYEGFDAKGDVIPQWAWLSRYSNEQWIILNPSRVFLPLTLKEFSQ